MNDPTNAERKRRMRQKRAKEGLTEIRVCLDEDRIECLNQLQRGLNLSRQEAVSAAIWAAFVGMQR